MAEQSMDVDCPWCIAKAGEPCWDFEPGFGGGPAESAFQRSDGQVHSARVKPDDMNYGGSK